MEKTLALDAFSALGQETRLDVFRLLVSAGPQGMNASEIADRLGVRQNTMSTNLAILQRARLISGERQGRSIRYRADADGIAALLSFLLEDCCGGKPDLCAPLIRDVACLCQ